MQTQTAKSILNDLNLITRLLNIGINEVCISCETDEAVVMRIVRSHLMSLYWLIDKQMTERRFNEENAAST